MDQKTTSRGSGDGTKKNWRDRLGINKDLPKIAAEFKEERRPPPPPPPLRPAMPPSKSASGRLVSGSGQQISRPAPMAPRVGNGPALRPAGSKPGAPPPRAKAPNKPAAKEPVVKAKVAPPPVQAPPPVANEAPAKAEAPALQEEAKSPPVPPVDDEFSARLRAQREAAERLASQRVGNLRLDADKQAAEEAEEAAEATAAAEKQAAIEEAEKAKAEAKAEAEAAQTAEAEASLEEIVKEAAKDNRQAANRSETTETQEAAKETKAADGKEAAPKTEPVEDTGGKAKRPKFGFAPEELSKPDTEEVEETEPAKATAPAPTQPARQPGAAVAAAAAAVAAVAPARAQPPQAPAARPPAQSPQPAAPQPKQPAAAQPAARQQPVRPKAPPRDNQPGTPVRGHGLAMPRGYPPGGQQPSAEQPAQAAIGAGAPPALRSPSRPADSAYNPYASQATRTAAAAAEAPAMDRSKAARPLDYIDDDLSEVFEDEQKPAPSRRRASAEDYSAAYRDFDDAFDNEEPQRNSGPMILILALLTVALLAGAVVYLYRTSTGTDTATPSTADPVVIQSPTDPVKEPPSTKQDPPASAQPASRRKQIYDRIQGETTLEPETITPSEETPQLPSVVAPSTSEGTSQTGSETEPLPLPLPPPPGSDQQGSLPASSSQTTARADQIEPVDSPPTTNEQTAEQTASGSTDLTALVPAVPTVPTPAPAASSEATQSAGDLVAALPLPEPPAPVGLPEPTAAVELPQPGAVQAIAPPEPAPIANVNRPPKPRSRPTRLASAATNQNATIISRPAPLPQPSQTVTTPPATGSGPILLAPTPPSAQVQAVQPVQPVQQPGFKLPNFLQQAQSGSAEQTSRRLPTGRGDDDPLAGTRNSVNSTTPSIAAPQQVTSLQQQQQVTPTIPQPAVAPKPAPSVLQQIAPTTPTAPAATGTGYVVQLASYRSEGEALNEFQRLRSRHGGLVGGLSSRIQRAELGAAGTFYRLGVGPIGDKASAKKLCNSLIAAGEKDCLVRRQ